MSVASMYTLHFYQADVLVLAVCGSETFQLRIYPTQTVTSVNLCIFTAGDHLRPFSNLDQFPASI